MPRSAATWEMCVWALLVVGLMVLPLLISPSFVFLTIDFFIMALFATSYNLLLGKTGMLSFGHAAYYGLGAYTVAILSAKLGLSVLVGIAAAPVVAGIVGLIIGFFCVRLSGFYFAILTMSFAQLVWAVVFGWYAFTGGDDGLPVDAPAYMRDPYTFFYIALAIVAVCIAILRLIFGSPFGSALAAIRENPDRAAFVGLNVRGYRLAAFTIAAAFAGVAGGLRAPLQMMAFPLLLDWRQSAEPVMMSLIGGFHTFTGPIVGAAIFVYLKFIITSYTQYSMLVFGAVVMFFVLLLPGGIVGFVADLYRNSRKRMLGMADLRARRHADAAETRKDAD